MAERKIDNVYLVNAPAGSGKTTKIVQMVNSLLTETSKNILCITYTNRAVDELNDKIKSKRIYISTIHSFFNDFLNNYCYSYEFIQLFIETFKDQINKKIPNDKNKGTNSWFEEKYGLELSYENVCKSLKRVYYTESKYSNYYEGGLSHDDLIIFAVNAFRKYKILGTRLVSTYENIFIDEYQDTNTNVLDIFIDIVKGTKSNLYLFGDPMQQIYDNYDGSLEDKFSQLNKSITLNVNYRSNSKIVSILNNIYNDSEFKQECGQNDKFKETEFLPTVYFTNQADNLIKNLVKKIPNEILLVLLNRERFTEIGAINLYDSFSKMEKYSYTSKLSAIDILTDINQLENDELLNLLLVISNLITLYQNEQYGNVIKILKDSKSLNNEKFIITKHDQKIIIKSIIEEIKKHYESQDTIYDFLTFCKNNEIIKEKYYELLVGDEMYEEALNVSINEFKSLVKFFGEKNVSTQHGVKGEGHESVIFKAESYNRNPRVNMKNLFMLWSKKYIDLKSFSKYCYDWEKFICELEKELGVSLSSSRKENYEKSRKEVNELISKFKDKNAENDYYNILSKKTLDEFISKPNNTKLTKIRKSSVKEVLNAYRLFYVGCSRAKENLAVVIDNADISGFEEELKERFIQIGFRVMENPEEV